MPKNLTNDSNFEAEYAQKLINNDRSLVLYEQVPRSRYDVVDESRTIDIKHGIARAYRAELSAW